MTARSFDEVVELIERPRKPTGALRQLLASESGGSTKPKRSRSRS